MAFADERRSAESRLDGVVGCDTFALLDSHRKRIYEDDLALRSFEPQKQGFTLHAVRQGSSMLFSTFNVGCL